MGVGVKSVAVSHLFLLACFLTIPSGDAAGQQTSSDNQLQAAIALEQQGKTAEAEAAWQSVLTTHPNSPEAYAHLGFLEAREQRYQQAISFYRKAMALDPRMPGLEMNLGLALFKAGELKEAVHIFDKLLKKEPSSSPEGKRLKTLIGMADYGLQEYAAAIPLLKEATLDDPHNLPFRLLLAHSCLAAKQYQCVLDTYHEILNLNAESAEADMLAGEALDEMQDHTGAIQQFRAAVKANAKEPNVHFGLGYLLWTQLQYPEAADEFKAELANVPDHMQALLYLADSNLKMNHPDLALPLLLKVVRLQSNTELAHLDLGIIYGDKGQHPDALRELRLAAQINPNDVAVHWRLGQLYRAMGRKDEAQAEFEKTKTLNQAAGEPLSTKLNGSRSQSEAPASGVPARN
jgi:tetratricopeptide (TPR) repeat protein